MEIQLKRLRKEAGYKSRDAFAAALGGSCNARQIKSWETGERMMSLEQACVLADFLRCSLDELAGRRFSSPAAPPGDPAEAALVGAYRDCAPQWKEQVLMSARAAAGMSKEAAERPLDAAAGGAA